MRVAHRRMLSTAFLLAGFSLLGADAHADIYTYALQAPAGTSGGALGGTITVAGNPGDPFPALNAVSAFALTYTPASGPVETWTQANTIDENYSASADFGGGGVLGTPTIFALTPASGANFWAVTGASQNEIDLYWTPSPYGPNWSVKSQGSVADYNFGGFSLVLRSDVVPEPCPAAFAAAPVGMLLRRRRRA